MRRACLALAAAVALLCAPGCSDDSSTLGDSGKDGITDLARPDGLADSGDSTTPDGPSLDGVLPDGPSPDGPTPDSGDGGVDAIAVTCPPAGPYGTNKGQTLPNLTLKDCAGNNHDIHDLCGKKAAWIFIFRGS